MGSFVRLAQGKRLGHGLGVITAAFLGTMLLAAPSSAKPWWWAIFTRGDGTNSSNSAFERWHAFFVASIPSNDTAYITSFTWGGGSIGPIDGINGGNDAGLNSHSTAGFPPDYCISDGSGSNWANAKSLTDADITDVDDGAAIGTMHSKDYFGASRGYIISSANQSGGGFRSQNNNSILFFDTMGMSAFMAKVREEMEEKASGTFHTNTPYGTVNFFSRNGDTVELRFGPDDNDGSLTAGSNSIGGRLATLAANAKESIFYMVDGWSIKGANQLDDKILNNTVAFKAGVAGDQSCGGGTDDWDATVYSNFENDHTLRCEAGAFNRLHTKTFIFDMEIVATGSPNATFFAMGSNTGNDESHVIVHDFRLARRYMAHYHKIMSAATPDPSSDAYDNTAPNAPTNLAITPSSTDFTATWTASTSPDVVRYYLFIDSAPIKSNFDIGDMVDDDGDGMYDEDPVGDVDHFKSGQTLLGATANNDDADNKVDEDPWMYPEVMVKGRSSTSGIISSCNVGDSLQQGVQYWFAIVAVDTQGNESLVDTAGPVQLISGETKVAVVKNGDITDTNIPRGGTDVVAASLWIRGDTNTADTLSFFSVRNLGLAGVNDVVVRLYRDENEDSSVSAVDTLVATLSYNASSGLWESTITENAASQLPTSGKTFLVTVDVYDTATLGDTFQASILAKTVDSIRWESGPKSGVTITGTITIVSANQLDLIKRGDSSASTINKDDTAVVMTARISVSQANDTLTAFAVTNLGNMTSADVARLAIYEDAGSDSLLTSADTLIGNLSFASGSTWRNKNLSYNFPGTALDILVVLTTDAAATGSRTFQAQVGTKEVGTVKADSGPLAAVSAAAVWSIPSDFGPDTYIVINEFMPNPSGTADVDNDGLTGEIDEEYVEIYNRGDKDVDVAGWSCWTKSAASERLFITSSESVIIRPGWFGVFKSEDGSQAGQRMFRVFSETGALVDTAAYSTNEWTNVNGVYNTTAPDTAIVKNASSVVVDEIGYFSNAISDEAIYRRLDGWNDWKGVGGGGTKSYAGPNGSFTVTANPSSIVEGDSTTLTITAKDHENATVASFNGKATLTSDTGTVNPTTTAAFSAGTVSESVSILNVYADGTVIVKASYLGASGATAGTVALNVTNFVPRIDVVKNSDIPDSRIRRGETNQVVGNFFITSDVSPDTLSVFAVRNTGTATAQDVVVKLWRDEDGDSRITAVDTLVARLPYSASKGLYEATLSDMDSAALGSSGKTFLVTLDVYDTAALNRTFVVNIDTKTARGVSADSGPLSRVTNNGTDTIISANQLTVTNRGDSPSATVAKGETIVAMQLHVQVERAGDTLTAAAIDNLGSMGASDVASLLLYEDAGSDSAFTSADTLIGALPFKSGSRWENTALSYFFPGDSMDVLVVLAVSASASGGASFQGEVAVGTFGSVRADSGPLSAVATTAVYTTPSDTAPDTAIVINEFINNPATMDHDNDLDFSDADEEYIELYNNSDGRVDVGNWDVADNSSGAADFTLPGGIVMGPRQFLVLRAEVDGVSPEWFLYDSAGVNILDSGLFQSGSFPSLNNSGDSVRIRNAANVAIDYSPVMSAGNDLSIQRAIDGDATWQTNMTATPGVTQDPSALDKPCPNGHIQITSSSPTVDEGDSVTLTFTIQDANNATVATFTDSVSISSDTANVNPTLTGLFAGGVRAESVSVTGMLATDSVVITGRYHWTTSGTVAITVYRLATITAVVDLQARADESGCTGVLANGVDTYVAVSNASGTITFNMVKSGTYQLKTKEDHHLRRVTNGVVVAGVDSNVNVGVHLAGDVNGDNRINIFDAAKVKFLAIYGVAPEADVDGNSTVDDADLDWIRQNFGKVGE